jgi:hypothetical protein
MSVSEESEKIDEQMNDSKNGILCWFYVYKKNETGKSSICGIFINFET